MKNIELNSFLTDFGNAITPQMNMSIYRDNFQCSCGTTHWFDECIDILAEGRRKVMVACPEQPNYLTALKIKTFMLVKFQGFESLSGTTASREEIDTIRYGLLRRR